MIFSLLSLVAAGMALGQFTSEVLPIDDQSITLKFNADIPADFVDAHYFINDPKHLRSLRMTKASDDAKIWTLPLAVLPGEMLMYKFTYQLTDGTGAKDTELMQFGEKKYDLGVEKLADSIYKVKFMPIVPDFVVDQVDLHYSTDMGATLNNIKLEKDGNGFSSTNLVIPMNTEKLQMWVTYIVGNKGVESQLIEVPLHQAAGMILPPRGVQTAPTTAMFNNLQARRDGYLSSTTQQLFNPSLVSPPDVMKEPFQQQVVSKGDYLWAIEFMPMSTPQFVDVNAEVSFQGNIYQINQKLENVGGNVWSHPPVPLGASDSILYRFTYWLEGMDGALESQEYLFSPSN